jgi:3-hydroxy-3-methylglutaryl CoA synthase
MYGITSYGCYLPGLRLERQAIVAANAWGNGALRAHSKGERTMCNWDEDSATLAVAAALACLSGREAP